MRFPAQVSNVHMEATAHVFPEGNNIGGYSQHVFNTLKNNDTWFYDLVPIGCLLSAERGRLNTSIPEISSQLCTESQILIAISRYSVQQLEI